ncbi:D-xylulose reductase A [Emergomyces pasteurianus Ep9510]|uniref:D-xylulose reductase n=1 Tax=Emergomyces pasteurianus Ep9510 TaxID=1447872 RepID=A0A1J9PN36_9EURO|nr:D-xylulose reductase A [Emergomyces pasteurianus Ep9510]
MAAEAPKNLSFVLEGVKKVSYQDRPIPTIQDPHDVQVHVKFTGVCGSDVHYWEHGSIGPFVLTSPMVLGHESSGIVTSIGPAVTSLSPGDKVALEPGIPCRRCEPCLSGKYNLCLRMAFAATPPIDGTLAKYYVLPEDFCHKLPENVELEEGALMEPLSVAVHITKQAGVQPGHSVVVFGVGPVGLLCCAVAKAFGASKVIAVDIQAARLEFAALHAASGIYMPAREVSAEQNAERLRMQHGLGRGADVVIDASGAEASVHTGIHVLRTGGTYVQGGMGRDVISFPILAVCAKELDVRGSFRYGSGDYKLALTLVEEGKVDVKKMVTGSVAFEEAERALLDVKGGKGIKTLIRGVED